MKKIMSFVLISSLLCSGTLLPAESRWQKAKKVLTSKPAMVAYGALMVFAGYKLAPYFLLNRGKKVFDAIESNGGFVEYLDRVALQSGELVSFSNEDTGRCHLHVYHTSSDEGFQKATQLLKKTMCDLHAYNDYLKSTGYPAYVFDEEVLHDGRLYITFYHKVAK